jgi:hypothetical protein
MTMFFGVAALNASVKSGRGPALDGRAGRRVAEG